MTRFDGCYGTNDEYVAAVRLRLVGWLYREIADKFDITPSTAAAWVFSGAKLSGVDYAALAYKAVTRRRHNT